MDCLVLIAYGDGAAAEIPAPTPSCDLQEWAPEQLLLPHPTTGQQACFLLQGSSFQEVNWFKPDYGSWFVNDMVLQDGGMTMCTPCDPLFVALPLLAAARQETEDSAGRFCGTEHILESEPYPDLLRLAGCVAPSLEVICDSKQVGTDMFYRVNTAKVKGWLCCKVECLQTGLKQSALGQAFQDMDSVQLAAYCIAMLAEFVQEQWLAELRDIYHVPSSGEENQASQAQSSQDSVPVPGQKRPRFDPKELAKKRAKEAKDEAKRHAMAKEASTMRSISSFFAKPKK
ncbi:hypothetical protein ABBQ38_007588 [Trebouxia sp. C0009 RCD-2024]